MPKKAETKTEVTYLEWENVPEGTFTLDSIFSKIRESKKGNRYLSVTIYFSDTQGKKFGCSTPLKFNSYLEGIKRYFPDAKKVTFSSEKYHEFKFTI